MPSPFIFWWQTESSISLRVDLRSVKDVDVNFRDRTIRFRATGVGALGNHDYGFEFELFGQTVPEKSHHRVTDRDVEILVAKKENDFWPRLRSSPTKLPYLRVDFTKLTAEDSEEEMLDDRHRIGDNSFRNIKDRSHGRKKKSEFSPEEFRKVYLFLYNMFLFVGFIYVLVVLVIRYAKEGSESMAGSYKALSRVMKFLHMMQILEILHPLLGYTRGEPVIPFLHVSFKLFMIFIMIDSESRMQVKPVVFYLFLIYSLLEITKYPYYLLRVFRVHIAFLTWLRHTVWIPLFPLSFICEGVILLRNIPYFEETGKFSVNLPNKANFSFHLPTFIRIYLLTSFFPFMWFAMNRMYRQRLRKLGPKNWQREFDKSD